MATKKTSSKKAATKKTVAPAPIVEKPVVAPAPTAKKAAKKAVKKAPAKKTIIKTVKSGTTRSPAITTVVADVDVGFGNHLYIRGEGAGLSWEAGLLMECVGDSEWTWSTDKASGNFDFKLIINDDEAQWSSGENFVAKAGAKTVVEPTF